MSRIGRSPVALPEGVSISSEGSLVKVKGKKGSLEFMVNKDMVVTESKGTILVDRKLDNREQK